MRVHDARSCWLSSALPRFAPGAGLGVLAWLVPPDLAREVLEAARRGAAGPALPARRLRLLPPLLGMYFTLALCLFSHLPYRDVLRGLPGAPDAAATALTGLRRRTGPGPLELLFWKVAGALSPGTAPWSHACGLLLVAWDGTTLKLPASEENKAWARGTGRGGHYPRARLVALAACGTRCLIAAAAGPHAAGEQTLAAGLTGHLRAGMLLLADRGFWSIALWQACAATRDLWLTPAAAGTPI